MKLHMRSMMGWVARAMAVYLAIGFAFLFAALEAVDYPPPSPAASLARGLVVGGLLEVGLFWSASARGRRRFFAALLMIPSGFMLVASAVEELSLIVAGRMHAPLVVFTYLVGASVYVWQFATLALPIRLRERVDDAVEA